MYLSGIGDHNIDCTHSHHRAQTDTPRVSCRQRQHSRDKSGIGHHSARAARRRRGLCREEEEVPL